MKPHIPRWMQRLFESLTGARHEGFAAYFPESASGRIQPRRGERIFWTDDGGLGFVGNTDGTMVPIDAWHIEATPENTFHPGKFSSLVDAIEGGDRPLVYPGYADLDVENGELVAIVRDGNHRTLAPFAAGATSAWVMISDNARQRVDRGDDKRADSIYRAIRKSQRAAHAPLFQRASASRLRKASPALDSLRAAEARWNAIDKAITEIQRAMLRHYGPARSGYTLDEQLQRPGLFWKSRVQEIYQSDRAEWERLVLEDTAMNQARALEEERTALYPTLYDLRTQVGMDPRTERLDPVTGIVQRR